MVRHPQHTPLGHSPNPGLTELSGKIAHTVFMILCLVNNIFASANMLLGAAAVVAAVSGMHIIAATFLIPVGVTVYTFVGGIKAT